MMRDWHVHLSLSKNTNQNKQHYGEIVGPHFSVLTKFHLYIRAMTLKLKESLVKLFHAGYLTLLTSIKFDHHKNNKKSFEENFSYFLYFLQHLVKLLYILVMEKSSSSNHLLNKYCQCTKES